jgi:hypothetical protein
VDQYSTIPIHGSLRCEDSGVYLAGQTIECNSNKEPSALRHKTKATHMASQTKPMMGMHARKIVEVAGEGLSLRLVNRPACLKAPPLTQTVYMMSPGQAGAIKSHTHNPNARW